MKPSAWILGATISLVAAISWSVFAGGPIGVTGPSSPKQGIPYTWDPAAMPIRYTVDSGPLSTDPGGNIIISNSAGLARVAGMFQAWQSVSTAVISFNYAGPISLSGYPAHPDIKTVADYDAAMASCKNGEQSPVIFDADGTIRSGLGIDPGVIGFSGACKIDPGTGHILSDLVYLNGQLQDGIYNAGTGNYELTADEFDQAITHELGHLLGLDHSQINVDVLGQGVLNCNADEVAGLPLMFPFFYCQTRVSLGLPKLAPDDIAWISKLYPGSGYSSNFGTISGTILFSDGITPVQGLNVIARRLDDPLTPQDESKTTAVSVVSGYLFTGNPGEPYTGTNTAGSPFGSRNPVHIGYFEIPVPPGTYTVQVENINSAFVGGSSVGPLDSPNMVSANEYWHRYESAYDDPMQVDLVAVQAGQTVTGINIILNGTPPRFDQFEGEALQRTWQMFRRLWARLVDSRDMA